MFSLTTDTLENFRRLKNDTMRVAAYIASSETPMVTDSLMDLQEGASALDVLEAFSKDMSKSVKYVNTLAKVLSKTSPNTGRCQELDGGEVDLRDILPVNSAGQVRLMGHTLVVGVGFVDEIKANEIRSVIYQNAMSGREYGEYERFLKLLKIEGQNDLNPETADFKVRLEEAARIASLDKVKALAQDVLNLVQKSFEIRQSLDGETKRKMDEVIYGGRAMIDGTTLSSTYLTQNSDEANEQRVASSHKKEPQAMREVKQLFDDMPFINAMEIDPDTDIVKFKEMLNSIKAMKLSNISPFELKSRKLGNYGASGLFAQRDTGGQLKITEEFGYASSKLKIVAVDVRSPTSLAHELAHYADTPEAPNVGIRPRMVRHFKSKLDLQAIAKAFGNRYADYLGNDREVIARLGEIGYLLNQVEFSVDESPQVIFERVRDWEKSRVEGKFTELMQSYIKENKLPVMPNADKDVMRTAIEDHQKRDREAIAVKDIARKASMVGVKGEDFDDYANKMEDAISQAMPNGDMQSLLNEAYRRYDADADKTLLSVKKKAKESGVNEHYAQLQAIAETLKGQSAELTKAFSDTDIAPLVFAISGLGKHQGYSAFRQDDLVKERTVEKLSEAIDGDFVSFIKPIIDDYFTKNTLTTESWFVDKVSNIRAAGGDVDQGLVYRYVAESFYGHVASELSSSDKDKVYSLMKNDDTFNRFISMAIEGGYEEQGIGGYGKKHDLSDFMGNKKEVQLLGGDVNYYVKVTKDLSMYLRDMPYFEMASWTSDELALVRDYAHGFYYEPSPEVEKRLTQSMDGVNEKVVTSKQLNDAKRFRYHKAVKEDDLRRKVWHSLPIEPHKMGQLFDVGKEEDLFLPGEFGFYFAEDFDVLYRKTPKGGLSMLGLKAQFTALGSLVQHVKGAENFADLKGLETIVEAYPSVVGRKRTESHGRLAIMQQLDLHEPNAAIKQAMGHKITGFSIVSDKNKRDPEWVATLNELNDAIYSTPQVIPKNAFMPVKAQVFVEEIQRGMAPDVPFDKVPGVLFLHNELNALKHIAYSDNIAHTKQTHTMANVNTFEVLLGQKREWVHDICLQALRESEIPMTTWVSDLPVIQRLQDMSGHNFLTLENLVEPEKVQNAYHALFFEHRKIKPPSPYNDIKFEQCVQFNGVSLITSALYQLKEKGLVTGDQITYFTNEVKARLVNSVPTREDVWDPITSAQNKVRSMQSGREGHLLESISPHITTLLCSSNDDMPGLKHQYRKELVNQLMDMYSASFGSGDENAAFYYSTHGSLNTPFVAVREGQNANEAIDNGTANIDKILAATAKGVFAIREDGYTINVPSELSSKDKDLKAFFGEMSERYGKELVDSLMETARKMNPLAVEVASVYGNQMSLTPVLKAAFAVQSIDFGYQAPRPKPSEAELEAIRARMKKASEEIKPMMKAALEGTSVKASPVKPKNDDGVKGDQVAKGSLKEEKPEIKPVDIPATKQEVHKPVYAGSPMQMKLF